MKDRPDIADNSWFSDEAHFYLNAQANKRLTNVSWAQKTLLKKPQETSEHRFTIEGTSYRHFGPFSLNGYRVENFN